MRCFFYIKRTKEKKKNAPRDRDVLHAVGREFLVEEAPRFTVQNFEIFAESLFHIWETRLECCLDGIDTSLAEVNHAWEILLAEVKDAWEVLTEAKDAGDILTEVKDAWEVLAKVNHAWEILFIFMMMKLRDGYHSTKKPTLN